MDDLTTALAATGATLAFDAIGGGKLAGPDPHRHGSGRQPRPPRPTAATARRVHKQVYIYGGLDTGPTELNRGFGMAWGLGGWLLTPFLQKIGPAEAASCASASRPNSRPPSPATTQKISLPKRCSSTIAAYNKRRPARNI